MYIFVRKIVKKTNNSNAILKHNSWVFGMGEKGKRPLICCSCQEVKILQRERELLDLKHLLLIFFLLAFNVSEYSSTFTYKWFYNR